MLDGLGKLEWTLVIGSYAHAYHLPGKASVTEHVRRWRVHAESSMIPLPHPSPRNNRWLRHNPWFEAELLPELRSRVTAALG